MSNVPPNGPPSVNEIARRVQRVEALLDERIATVDMLKSSERLFEARELGHIAEVSTLKDRITRLENANSSLTKMVVGAFLGLLIQFVILLVNVASRGGVS